MPAANVQGRSKFLAASRLNGATAHAPAARFSYLLARPQLSR